MGMLILGLVLFLGLHSVRIVADGWRSQVIAQRGQALWKGVYTLLSIAGFALIVWGYGQARQEPVVLWPTPLWTRHLAALLMLVAMVLLVAAYVPRNHLKLRLGHPMLLSVKVWALAHLLANNTLADVLLFGGFLAWAVPCFVAARGRDRLALAHGAAPVLPAKPAATALVVVLGLALWAALAFAAHAWLFGVKPFGR